MPITTIIEILASASHAPIQVMQVGPDGGSAGGPVLLYLHGKASASTLINDLPQVCRHHTPPFQAMLGRLPGTTVIAPQAPCDPTEPWSWRPYLPALRDFMQQRFAGRRIVGTGFSRGGLGVLQLAALAPDLLARWAIVDPQHPPPDQAEALLSLPDCAQRGWLRFGPGLPNSRPYSAELAQRLQSQNVCDVLNLAHSAIALAAYQAESLGGESSLYAFLGLHYAK